MAIDIEGSIDKVSNAAFSYSFFNKILSNPLFIGIAIALIFILLLMVYYPAKKGTSLLIPFKIFLYTFLSSFLIVFLHDSVIKHTISQEYKQFADEELIGGLNHENRDGIYNNTAPVKPTGEFHGGNYIKQIGGNVEQQANPEITPMPTLEYVE